MPTFVLHALGCKVNQYETELVREGLLAAGYREAAPGEPADLCVVNTCTVTAESDAKSRKTIRQFARRHPRAEIVVMGCYAARAADELADLPGVAEVFADKSRLGAWLESRGARPAPRGISRFGRRHRAYVKVQDGCRMRCAYCIVPHVRGAPRSRPAEEVRDEVARLVATGHREIVLVGIHLGHYGVDLPGGSPDLAALVRRLAQLDGEFRLRLSSIEAAEVTDSLLAALAECNNRICPHLHLPLQSGSDAVLRAMGRPGGVAEFLELCRRVRERLDQPALTGDVIVGFPGEAEEDFEATCRAVEAAGFSKLHVFRFSPRPGTAAATMPRHTPERVVHQRARRLERIGRALRQRFLEGLVGGTLEVLVEEPVPRGLGRVRGTCRRYAPVELPAEAGAIGQLVAARAVEACGGRLMALP